jgi:hypothetical protein
MRKIARFPALLAVALAIAATTPARAAESYDNCKGFITSLPAVISTQGAWCLKGDLATTITTGNAITITANNVVLDCNEFKLGGLGAGPSTFATGIHAPAQNTTIRNCNVRGFQTGVRLYGDGQLVEDNRLDGMVTVGIEVGGEGNVVRRNRIIATGGVSTIAVGISVSGSAEVRENLVSDVYAAQAGMSYGIAATLTIGSISGNQVRNVYPAYLGTGAAIFTEANDVSRASIVGNDISNMAGSGDKGVVCDSSGVEIFRDNAISGFSTSTVNCADDGGNVMR